MSFVRIDVHTARIVILTDVAFANNPDHDSLLGSIVVIVDNNSRCNILLYRSTNSTRMNFQE